MTLNIGKTYFVCSNTCILPKDQDRILLKELQFVMSLKILWRIAYTVCHAPISIYYKYVTGITMTLHCCLSDIAETTFCQDT